MNVSNLKTDFRKSAEGKYIFSFLVRLLILSLLWFLVYGFFFQKKRIIDRPLTNFVTMGSVKAINLLSSSKSQVHVFTPPGNTTNTLLMKDDKKVLGIYDGCNGLDLMFIYMAVIVLLPGAVKRKVVFCALGCVAIILANILRIFLLYMVLVLHPASFDISHHYLFTLVMYALIFYGWLLYIKKAKLSIK